MKSAVFAYPSQLASLLLPRCRSYNWLGYFLAPLAGDRQQHFTLSLNPLFAFPGLSPRSFFRGDATT